MAQSGQDSTSEGVFKTFFQEVKAHLFSSKGLLELDYFTLFWIFVVGSIIGLFVESIYGLIVLGAWESRAGLLWGPFSPIYGVGAICLTVFLNRYYHSHNLIIFLIAMVVGSCIEFFTHLGMELVFGMVSWNYDDTFGSIQGRTNFFFGMMWGLLGLLWVRAVLPFIKWALVPLNKKNMLVRIVTIGASVFILVNIVCTFAVWNRASARVNGEAPTNFLEEAIDVAFPDSFTDERFENLTFYNKEPD
jgi:uncharacterized membrane protein